MTSLNQLEPSDILWITVPDDQIAPLAKTLAETKIIAPGTLVVHCSGVLSSAVLTPLAQQGCYTASLHPLKVFKNHPLESTAFHGCYCTLEGHPEATNILEPLFKALGAILVSIKPEQKTTYHAAAVIASNYVVTLASLGTQLLNETGIKANLAKLMIQQLMQSSLNAIETTSSLEDALTGPLARGDIRTIKSHMEGLNEKNSRDFYRAAALATLPLTSLNTQQKKDMEELLNHQT